MCKIKMGGMRKQRPKRHHRHPSFLEPTSRRPASAPSFPHDKNMDQIAVNPILLAATVNQLPLRDVVQALALNKEWRDAALSAYDQIKKLSTPSSQPKS
jgi:hypothetical protein